MYHKINPPFLIVFVLLVLTGLFSKAQEPVKIISYNTLDGHFKDSQAQDQFLSWIKEEDPEIIAFQEMNGFTQKYLEKFAKKYGHSYAVLLKEEGYPVALTSQNPIVKVEKVTDNMHHGYILAYTSGLYFFVTHLSPLSYQKRAQELRTILERASLLPEDAKIIIAGDFNAFSRKDSIYYGKDMLKSRKKRDKKYKHTNLNKGRLDFSVMDLIDETEFVDTYGLFNPGFSTTLPTHINKDRVKRRIDYIWVNKNLESDVQKSGVIQNPITDELSDHYPIYIEMRR